MRPGEALEVCASSRRERSQSRFAEAALEVARSALAAAAPSGAMLWLSAHAMMRRRSWGECHLRGHQPSRLPTWRATPKNGPQRAELARRSSNPLTSPLAKFVKALRHDGVAPRTPRCPEALRLGVHEAHDVYAPACACVSTASTVPINCLRHLLPWSEDMARSDPGRTMPALLCM